MLSPQGILHLTLLQKLRKQKCHVDECTLYTAATIEYRLINDRLQIFWFRKKKLT